MQAQRSGLRLRPSFTDTCAHGRSLASHASGATVSPASSVVFGAAMLAMLAPATAGLAAPPPIEVVPAIRHESLQATSNPADPGLDEGGGIHWVDVRIVSDLVIDVRLEADRDVVLASAPRLCLVGPFWNPLDAGLSDRCWGQPDLSELLAGRLAHDVDGHFVLPGKTPIEVHAPIERGTERCDYPPGDWQLEVAIEPLIDGEPAARVYLPDVKLHVPFGDDAPLEYVISRDTRFCSYADAIFRRQGKPVIPDGNAKRDRPVGSLHTVS